MLKSTFASITVIPAALIHLDSPAARKILARESPVEPSGVRFSRFDRRICATMLYGVRRKIKESPTGCHIKIGTTVDRSKKAKGCFRASG
jgi:hypothetical protein